MSILRADHFSLTMIARGHAARLANAGHIVEVNDHVGDITWRSHVNAIPTIWIAIRYEDEKKPSKAFCALEMLQGDYEPPWLKDARPMGHLAVLCMTDLATGETREVAAATSKEAYETAARLLSL